MLDPQSMLLYIVGDIQLIWLKGKTRISHPFRNG